MTTVARPITDSQRNAIEAMRRFWPKGWKPTAAQWRALANNAEELLYGGAAGGGKSELMLARAALYAFHADSHALILRKTLQDLTLPDALLSRAKDWWLSRKDVKWNGNDLAFTFPSGASVTFGYLKNADSHLRYDGGAYTFIGIDEGRQIPGYQLQYMNSRLRTPEGCPIPTQLMIATNPGGASHDYLKARFIDDATRDDRCDFVPADLDDNPHLDTEAYERRLDALDPIERARLRHGNWDVREQGNMFDREKFQYYDTEPEGIRWVRSWDFAATKEKPRQKGDPDYTVGMKFGEKNGQFFIADVLRGRYSPPEVEDNLKTIAASDTRSVEILIEEEPGSSGKMASSHITRNVLPGYSVIIDKPTGDKTERARGLSSAVANGNVYLRAGATWIHALLDEYGAFPQDDVHDDQVDTGSQAHAYLTLGARGDDGWAL